MQAAVTLWTVITVLLVMVFLYSLYCLIDLCIFIHNLKNGQKENKHFNLYRVLFKLKGESGKNTVAGAKLKKAARFARKICFFVTIALLILSIVSYNIFVTMKTLNDAAIAAAAFMGLNKDNEGKGGPGEEEKDDNDWTVPVTPGVGDTSDSSSGTGTGGNSLSGNATGKCTVKLDDGTYYWYHQGGRCTCKWCGTWSNIQMPEKEGPEPLSKAGCAFYSLSIIISNLIGEQIDPRKLMLKIGCTIDENNYWHGDGKYFPESYYGVPNYHDFPKDLAKMYGLEAEHLWGSHLGYLSTEEKIKRIDNILSKGGYVWIYKNSPHFIAIRRNNGDSYSVFDEVIWKGFTKEEYMNKSFNKKTLVESLTQIIGFYNPNAPAKGAPTNNGNDGVVKEITSSGEWYSDANKIKKFNNKIDLGDGVYLYDGLPWEPESDTYIANTDTMAIDMYKFMTENSSVKPMNGTWNNNSPINGFNDMLRLNSMRAYYTDTSADCNCQYTAGNMKGDAPFKNLGGGQVATIDGVNCLGAALPAAVVQKDYCNQFKIEINENRRNWLNFPAGEFEVYNYGHKRMAAVLFDKTNNKYYYLPTTNCDAKGFTFPGGVCQTGVTVEKQARLENGKLIFPEVRIAAKSNASMSSGFDTYKDVTIEDIAKLMNQDHIKKAGTNGWDATWNVGEYWNVPTKASQTLNKFKYRVVGYVVWTDDYEG